MGTMASQITSLAIVYSTVYSGADHKKHQSSVSLAFVRGIHRWPVNSQHKGPVTRKMFPFDDVIMYIVVVLSTFIRFMRIVYSNAPGLLLWHGDNVSYRTGKKPLSQPILTACMMTSSNGNIFRVTGPLCGEFTGPGEFPTQRPVTRSFDVFFDRRLNKRSSKQPRGWWLETLSCSLWRQSNGKYLYRLVTPYDAIWLNSS